MQLHINRDGKIPQSVLPEEKVKWGLPVFTYELVLLFRLKATYYRLLRQTKVGKGKAVPTAARLFEIRLVGEFRTRCRAARALASRRTGHPCPDDRRGSASCLRPRLKRRGYWLWALRCRAPHTGT